LSIRRDVFVSVGGFDDDLPGYGWQDVDLMTRVRQAGFRVVFNPPMAVYHALYPRLQDARGSRAYSKRRGLHGNLSYVHAKNFGILSALYLRFFFTYQTGLFVLLRRPSVSALKLCLAGWQGKLQGLARYVRLRMKKQGGRSPCGKTSSVLSGSSEG
jgi:GT2 family glycosyltransferase